jgi:GNAT superfamily N-acetyltransferase
MNPALVFRRARVSDARPLTGIALAGKKHWGYPDEWMEAWRYDLEVTPEYIRSEPVEVAELNGELLGFVGLSTGEDGRYLEHLWMWPKYIGQGFGRVLFDRAAQLAREEGVAELRIKADPNAEPFYRKMGAQRIGQEVYYLLGKVRREVPLLSFRIQ